MKFRVCPNVSQLGQVYIEFYFELFCLMDLVRTLDTEVLLINCVTIV